MKALQEYTREFCPIWGHKGWCGRREDGLVLCKRPPTPKASGYTFKGMARDGQTGMFVEIGRELRRGNRTIRRPPVHANITSGAGASPDVRPSLETRFTSSEGAFTPERRAVLAQELGLPEPALDELKIGWSDTASHHDDRTIAGAWVFPEFDGQGRMIGASYRFPQAALDGKTGPDGKPLGCKSSPAGLQRGLTLPLGWREMPDPILVVEGASDVLAGRAVGLSVIGRPSNTGGAGYVAQACRQRRVIILGENDRKSDGRWPGKEGAELTCRKLEAIWDRPVPVAFPSEGIKDLRDWVTQIVSDWSADLSGIRNSILEAVNPPKLLLLAKPQRRGRPVVEIFAWSGGAEAQPLHSDRVDTKEAPARRRFVQAVSKIKPNVDVDDLTRRLLLLKVAPEVAQDVTRAPADNTAVGSWQSGDGQLPTVFLPGGPTRITESAEELGGLLARAGEYFVRGGAVMTVGRDDDALTVLEALKPASLASAFEKVFKLGTYIRSGAGFTPVEAICREQDAKLIQNCRTFRQALPPIRILSRCPVLVEKDGKLIQASEYDRDSGILAFGDPVPEVGLTQAVTLLHGMLADFRFATDSDRARALAAVITPALIFGGLLNGRAPIDLGEADQSQTGKGYRNKLTAGTYCCKVKTVTQRKGGVGSLEESFASALIKGYNFIALDNVRGTIDSPAIEFFLTEDSFLARIPYLAAVEIDPRRVILQLTSNRADITVDLANRSSCVRILKQPEGRLFRQYPGGDVLDHVQAHQPLYLGAVFAVVRAWHEAGKPTTKETRHDFRPWARTLDWIVQEIFQAGPLLDGHRETRPE